MSDGKSIPKIPQWGREDLARAFALVVRDAIRAGEPNARALAQIVERSEDTLRVWAKGAQDKLPGGFVMLQIIDALDAWRRFRALLTVEEDGLIEALERAVNALECAKHLLGNHPGATECGTGQNQLRRVHRLAPLETELVRHADALIAAAEAVDADSLQASADRRMSG